LLGRQPVAGTTPKLLYTLHAGDSGCQFRAQQARIGSFVSKATHGGKMLIDCRRRQTARFQVHAVTNDHDAVES